MTPPSLQQVAGARKADALLQRYAMSGAVLVITLLMLLMGLMFYRQSTLVYHARNWVVHTYEVGSQIQTLMAKIRDVRSGQRGYALTHDSTYLKLYYDTVTDTQGEQDNGESLIRHRSLTQQLAYVRAMTTDNPIQQGYINELESILNDLLPYLAASVAMEEKEAGKPPSMTQAADILRVKPWMDRIRFLIDAMMVEENRLLNLRIPAAEAGMHENNRFTLSAVGIFYVCMMGAMLLAMHARRKARGMEEALYSHAQEIVETNQKLKTANQELANSKLFLKNIINHVVDPIFVKDQKHRWIDGNNAFWALMGKSEAELIGKSDYELFPKEQADIFWQKDAEVFATGHGNVNEEFLTDAAGKIHILSTKKACFKGSDGEQILVGIIRDITELQEMQRALRASDETRLASIMEHSGRPVYIRDLDGRYLQVNSHLLRLFKREEKDIIGKTNYDLFPAEFKSYVDDYRKHDCEVAEKGIAIEFEEFAPLEDGIHAFTSVKFPLYDANKRLYAICGMSTDITGRKLVEARLALYMRELERSNQELDDFAYIASHDLKEPLRGLFNHASFLLEDYQDKLDADGVHRLNRLSSLAQRMEHLVNDLLYFSRLGRTELAIQDTDPNAIVVEVRQLMETLLKERNARILVPAALPHIVCDRPRITEVFRNLITNAVKYNDKPEPVIEVGFLKEAPSPEGLKQNVFYVRDNGIGIEPEFHQAIFRIFKRLHAADSAETGTGVGLTFVKKIIERHKGHIWLESEPSKGSTFYFTLANA